MSPNASNAPEVIDEFADVLVTIEARLEDRLMNLEEIARIEPGSIIPLHRAAGETVDVHVGNVRFGSAEVVVIEDALALRITEFDGLNV